MNPRIPDARVDGRLIGLRNNGPLVHISQITIAPFEEEDDIEVSVGDFSRETLVAALRALDENAAATTGAIRTLPAGQARPARRGGVNPRWVKRWWR